MIDANHTNSFKNKLDKFWANGNVKFYWRYDLTGGSGGCSYGYCSQLIFFACFFCLRGIEARSACACLLRSVVVLCRQKPAP